MVSTRSWAACGCLLAALGLSALAGSAARADTDSWESGRSWLYVRGGYAKNGADGAANGGAGYGFGYRHMLTPSRVDRWGLFGRRPLGFLHWTLFKNWSFGGFVEYDVLGRYGSTEEIEIPAAVELTRHIMFKSAARPYLTVGLGPYYRKTYGTGNDLRSVSVGGLVATGFDVAVAPHQLLGLDTRVSIVDNTNTPANPVFGPGQSQAAHWSVKLAYALSY